MKRIRIITPTIMVLGCFFIITLSSCPKPDNPRAVITILDTSDNTIQGAIVTVQPNTEITSYIKDVKISDMFGQTTHEFEEEMILDVTAHKDYTIIDDSLHYVVRWAGTGILVLEKDKTYEETIVLRNELGPVYP